MEVTPQTIAASPVVGGRLDYVLSLRSMIIATLAIPAAWLVDQTFVPHGSSAADVYVVFGVSTLVIWALLDGIDFHRPADAEIPDRHLIGTETHLQCGPRDRLPVTQAIFVRVVRPRQLHPDIVLVNRLHISHPEFATLTVGTFESCWREYANRFQIPVLTVRSDPRDFGRMFATLAVAFLGHSIVAAVLSAFGAHRNMFFDASAIVAAVFVWPQRSLYTVILASKAFSKLDKTLYFIVVLLPACLVLWMGIEADPKGIYSPEFLVALASIAAPTFWVWYTALWESRQCSVA